MGSEGKRVEIAERLERAVDELRTVARKSRPDDYPGNWRLRVGELLAVWDEAVAEGRPALVGEDAEAPVCGGPTDAFDVAPPDAPCPVPPKPEPYCCTDDEDLFDEEDNEPWGLDAMDDMEKLREGLADLKKRFEEHIAL